jgi:hypothetical protein
VSSDHGPATTPAGSAGLPSVASGLLDTASIHAPPAVASVSPPALDLQGTGAVLPPVQAVDQVRQASSSGSPGVLPSGSVVPLAVPEPGPLVLLGIASAAYLGINIRRRRRASAS